MGRVASWPPSVRVVSMAKSILPIAFARSPMVLSDM